MLLIVVAAVHGFVSKASLKIGSQIASGNFGTVHWAHYDSQLCVAKVAAPVPRASGYLDVEAQINRLLHERTPGGIADGSVSQYVAPYLGSCVKDGKLTLLWHANPGSPRTLAHYLRRGAAGSVALAGALGCETSMHSLGKRVLGDIVAALAHSHACGIVHRDVKPENLLVDATYGCLRLIDFGSACDCAGWLVKRGYRPDRVPCSVLYCPPEQLLDGRMRIAV